MAADFREAPPGTMAATVVAHPARAKKWGQREAVKNQSRGRLNRLLFGTRFHALAGFAFTALALSSCAGTPEQRSNFEHCLVDDYACNSTLLTGRETEQLIEARGPQHFLDCLAGRRCNEARLSEAELVQVRRTVGHLNFEACLRGEATCNLQNLSSDQRSQVDQAGGVRNFMYCVSGLSACARSVLTDDQRAAAHDAYLQRNFAGCMNSVGTLLGCNLNDLSAGQRELVQQRNLEVNFYICSNALIGCVADLLTPEQRSALRLRR